jgi:hypothetical protein
MTELEIIPHPDEQRSLAELRSEFRDQALANLRDQYAGYHPCGWAMIGDPARARDKYSAESWSFEMLHRLDDPVTQDFGLTEARHTWSTRLEKEAQAALAHDSVTWDDSVAGVADSDALACADVTHMTDEELCEYVDAAIKESARG